MPTSAATSAACYARLAGSAALAPLLSAPGAIYPGTVPAEARAPYIVMQQISGAPAMTHGEPAGDATVRAFQFACFAPGAAAALALRDAVIAALDGVALATGETPTLTDERDGGFDEAVYLYRADADISV